MVDIAPLAMCELMDDPANPYDNEFGYERGVSYSMADANPIGAGTAYAINPTTTVPPCNGTGSTEESLPYFCTGRIAFTPTIGQSVLTNPGIAVPQLEALDSRFGNQKRCDAITAPPDRNIKSYDYTDSAPGSLRDWMGPDPDRQSMRFAVDPITNVNRPVPIGDRTFKDYGVLWSASRPAGSTVPQWPLTPPDGGYAGDATSYPETSPYAQGNGSIFFEKPTPTGKPERRVLNLPIVTCPTTMGETADRRQCKASASSSCREGRMYPATIMSMSNLWGH
ncbi:hypothetical protein LP416_28310 [Polaromonas sp. P2-4]|nr:hypothetical protein LP416_28310 [Polaromonas sp. P2-4]